MTTSGFRTVPQSAQRRAAAGSATTCSRRLGRPHARQLAVRDRAVHLDHVARAGALVQAVDVLGDHRLARGRARSSSASARWPAFGSASASTPRRRP